MVLLVFNNILVNNYLFLNKKNCLNNNNRRPCWSGAHCHRRSLMAVSTSRGIACRLSYRRMVDIEHRHLYSLTLLFVEYVITDELFGGVYYMIISKLSVCGSHVDRMWRHLSC